MSTTPMISGSNLKSFWSRPEGKTGILALAALGILALWGWGAIVPFVLSMMVDTIHLALLVGGFIAGITIVSSKRTHMMFRVLMRAITGIFITIDPIGILKDKLQQMRKKRERFGEQVSSVAGSISILKQTITKNHEDATKSMKEAEFAKQQVGKIQNSTEQLRYQLQVKVRANKAGRLENANISYQQLLTKLQSLYDFLVRWTTHLDAYIDDTDDQVKQEEIRYKTLNSAYGAFKSAMSILKGNATEEDIYNSTFEYLAEDAGRKLGEIDDMQRVADNFMTNLDIQNGAVSDDALKALDAYEAKMLSPGNTETSFLLPSANAIPVDQSKVLTAKNYSSYFER